MLKKIFLLIVAALCAIALSETIVTQVLRFPPYGVAQKVRYRIGGETWSNIREPGARVYNVENKTHTHANNYGLPGNDIINLDNPVVLLGSSLVEALQHKPEELASSVFENEIRKADPTIDVLNLGYSGHDPYDSYFRLKYFEKKLGFRSEKILLVVGSDPVGWFARHPKPLSFQLPEYFGAVNDNPLVNAQIKLRNCSSLVELFVRGLIKGKAEKNLVTEEHQNSVKQSGITPADTVLKLSDEMQQCLRAFRKDYMSFTVISISGDDKFNAALSEFCDANRIEDIFIPVIKPEYLIGGAGHLSKSGNHTLGVQLANKYQKILAFERFN